MKQSKHPELSPSSSKANRARIFVVLGCLSLAGAAGYELGQGSHNEPVMQLPPEGGTEPEKALNQCRKAVTRLSKRGKLSEGQLGQLRHQICQQPDEVQCGKVLDSAANDRAYQLADDLDITNTDDIDKLIQAMRKGHTKVNQISSDGKYITLTDPNADPEDIDSKTWINLEEAIEEVPTEYLSDFDKVPKTDDLLALEQQLADGDADGIVRDLDLEEIRPEGDEDSSDAIMHGHLTDLQGELAKTTDPVARKDLFCQFIATAFRQEMSDESIDEPESETTPESVKQSRLMSLYMNALSKSVGVEDTDECMSHIFDPSPCNCSEGE